MFPSRNNEGATGENPTLIETIFAGFPYFSTSGDSVAVQLAKICTKANDKCTSDAFSPTNDVN